jgi:UDP-glucuronate decarboxylase
VRALVTGGAGFLGSHLCDRLLADGNEVTALDDFTTGSPDNLAHLADHPRFRLVRHDVCRPYDFAVDRIYNFACPASPPRYQADPVRTTLISVLGTLHALECAERHGARVLQASTSEVYGDPLVHPQREDYRGHVSCTGPRACYDEGKRCAETLMSDFHRTGRGEVRVVRIFNTYGPRLGLHDGRVVGNFIVQALLGLPLTLYGDGRQTRSFCFVDDLIDGIVGVMERFDGPQPVNIGNPVEFTVSALAELVLALTGSRGPIERRPLPADDPVQRRPDISLARSAFGFEPRTSLEEGLVPTVNDFRVRLRLPALLESA